MSASEQKIFNISSFVEYLQNKFNNEAIDFIYVFFFNDKVKQVTSEKWWFGPVESILFNPIAIIVQHSYAQDELGNRLRVLSIDEMKEEFGNDFGFKVSLTEKRQLDPNCEVNILKIICEDRYFDDEKGDRREYFPSWIESGYKFNSIYFKLMSKYYEKADKFKFRKKVFLPFDSIDNLADFL